MKKQFLSTQDVSDLQPLSQLQEKNHKNSRQSAKVRKKKSESCQVSTAQRDKKRNINWETNHQRVKINSWLMFCVFTKNIWELKDRCGGKHIRERF